MNETIGLIVGIAGITTIAGYLVAFFKLAHPAAAPATIVAAAIIAGELSALLVTAASNGLQFTQQGIATMAISGIVAAAAAAGLSRTDQKAEEKRIGSDVQANREAVAELGAKAEKEAAKP